MMVRRAQTKGLTICGALPYRGKQMHWLYRSQKCGSRRRRITKCLMTRFHYRSRPGLNTLASGPPIAFRYMKENICRAAASADALECMDLEATHNVHCSQTEDHRAAVKAFMEKRKPIFSGR